MNNTTLVKLLLLILCGIGTTGQADAAQVAVIKDKWGTPFIEIRGDIEEGDLQKVQSVSSEFILSAARQNLHTPLNYRINTGGGNAYEAIKIGRFFRSILASVQVFGKTIYAKGSPQEQFLALNNWLQSDEYLVLPDNAPLSYDMIGRNHSAGILIFYGAVKRSLRDNMDQRSGFHSIPVMAVHRPSFPRDYFTTLSPAQAMESYSSMEASVKDYLLEMGAPQTLIDRMINQPSNSIELIPEEAFRNYYRSEEPFLQEWLIAKCGTNSQQDGLSAEEQANYRKINSWQFEAKAQDPALVDKPAYYIYPTAGFSAAYVDKLYAKVSAYNNKIDTCRESAIAKHQLEWALSPRNRGSAK